MGSDPLKTPQRRLYTRTDLSAKHKRVFCGLLCHKIFLFFAGSFSVTVMFYPLFFTSAAAGLYIRSWHRGGRKEVRCQNSVGWSNSLSFGEKKNMERKKSWGIRNVTGEEQIFTVFPLYFQLFPKLSAGSCPPVQQ